ncbi:MAG: phosphatidate cytidylyltransferase, partial [Acidimicrobiales bacterium]
PAPAEPAAGETRREVDQPTGEHLAGEHFAGAAAGADHPASEQQPAGHPGEPDNNSPAWDTAAWVPGAGEADMAEPPRGLEWSESPAPAPRLWTPEPYRSERAESNEPLMTPNPPTWSGGEVPSPFGGDDDTRIMGMEASPRELPPRDAPGRLVSHEGSTGPYDSPPATAPPGRYSLGERRAAEWRAPEPPDYDQLEGEDPPRPYLSTRPDPERALPEEGITMTGGAGTEMPHWTDPPTGEVPRILSSAPGGTGDNDLAAWEALGSRGMRWRDDGDDWNELDFDQLGDGEARLGALDTTRSEHSDLYSFDEDFERLEEERSGSHPVVDEDDDYGDFVDDNPAPVAARTGTPRTRGGPRRPVRPRRPRGGGGSGPVAGGEPPDRSADDVRNRTVVGVGLVVLLLLCWAIGPQALVVLSAVIIVAAAAEGFGMLQHSGFRPATLLGLVATAGVVFGAYWRGVEALPLACVLVFAGSMLWYLLGIVDARPLANVAVTTMTFLWVGVLGSFGALLLRSGHGSGLFVGALLPAIAADVGAFVVGGRIGRRPMAPVTSPGKTVEGFLGGLASAIVVGVIVGKELTPWGGLTHGFLLGLVVGLVAPLGDLFESMVKRDLSVKHSGTLLPGHGGVLDRFDAILLVLPAAYYLAYLFNLVHP